MVMKNGLLLYIKKSKKLNQSKAILLVKRQFSERVYDDLNFEEINCT